ncbi:MAG: hypothetical protein IPJ30_23790 [Acidobacteria bacterium]|nr:hypothetical protein [Acidobacteriota bacterium]
MDRGLDGVENSIGFDPIIGYSAIPIYNEGLRVESVHLIATVRGAIDMLRRPRDWSGSLL